MFAAQQRVRLTMRTNLVFWPAIAVWALVPGFSWLGKLLIKVEVLPCQPKM